jgi:hypothetical protein
VVVAVVSIHCECDWCGDTEDFTEPGDEYEAGWITVKLPPDGRDKAYCSDDCLTADL